MTYSEQWKALASRIRGLMQAGRLYMECIASTGGDTFYAGGYFSKQCTDIISKLELFRDEFKELLPSVALISVNEFLNNTGKLISNSSSNNITKNMQKAAMLATLVQLAAFESEITFLLSDVQESIHVRSERAFSHLQRSIVADTEFRNKWQAAFKNGEVECEKLGAVHLLLHGIWAFKVNEAGERTDLVFQDIHDFTDAQRYADGIVLTEWKVAKKPTDNGKKKFEEARNQARRYTQGVLAGSELAGYRYVVVVSRQQLAPPEDSKEGEVVYRHINIAVDPLSPSQSN